jgi:hypothetical protein
LQLKVQFQIQIQMIGNVINKIFLVLFLCVNKSIYSQHIIDLDSCFDVYFMPRSLKSICFYIPKTQFEKKSEKVKYADRNYFTTSLNDSVYEMFYLPICIPFDLLSNLIEIQDATPNCDPRIILFGPQNEKILIDEKMWVYIDTSVYKMPEKLWEILFDNMPCDLAENWLINYCTDGMDDTYLRKLLILEE